MQSSKAFSLVILRFWVRVPLVLESWLYGKIYQDRVLRGFYTLDYALHYTQVSKIRYLALGELTQSGDWERVYSYIWRTAQACWGYDVRSTLSMIFTWIYSISFRAPERYFAYKKRDFHSHHQKSLNGQILYFFGNFDPVLNHNLHQCQFN